MSSPRLKLGRHLGAGVAAVALFGVMVAAFLPASFGDPSGFADGASITASIGYAMFDLTLGDVPSESFLVAFEIVDLVLVAALAGAVMLARRERAGSGSRESAASAVADGGRVLRDSLAEQGLRDTLVHGPTAERDATDEDDGGDR